MCVSAGIYLVVIAELLVGGAVMQYRKVATAYSGTGGYRSLMQPQGQFQSSS
jgi:hypothetical protein